MSDQQSHQPAPRASEPPYEPTEAEIAALLSDDDPTDPDDVAWSLTDEFYGTDEAERTWLANLPPDVRADYERGPWDGTGEAFAAGFLHHDPGNGPAGPGFSAGGLCDTAPPGPWLAAAAADAHARRGELGESELIGLLCGWQRLTSWAQAGQAACLTTLVQRRKAQSTELARPELAEHVDDEAAAALALTGRSAARILQVSVTLAGLPEVLAALSAGWIDWAKACLFADLLAGLPGEVANDIAAAVLGAGDVSRKTSGQLRTALARAILAYDPDAAQRRREQARKDASVQTWAEPSGNGALAGRELSPADVVHADAQLTADARWLAAHGLPGSTDELRAQAFTARLTGRSLHSLLPPSGGDPAVRTGPGASPEPSPSPGRSDIGNPDSPNPDSRPLGGTINLTMPLSAWAGLSDAPGDLAGHGPADAATCRDLAARTGPETRWCLTLTTGDGRAVAHACAGHRFPTAHDETGIGGNSPADAGPVLRWAAGLRDKLQYLETGICGHARQSTAYRPPPPLVHLIQVRQRTCSFPGCCRAARRCDLDHVVPFGKGGATCECNLTPLCRRHHRGKQTPRWHLTQPEPGTLIWQLPHSRSYTVIPEPYPACPG